MKVGIHDISGRCKQKQVCNNALEQGLLAFRFLGDRWLTLSLLQM